MPSDDSIGLLMDTVVKVTGLTPIVIGCCVVVSIVAVPSPAELREPASTAWARAAAPGVLAVIVFW